MIYFYLLGLVNCGNQKWPHIFTPNIGSPAEFSPKVPIPTSKWLFQSFYFTATAVFGQIMAAWPRSPKLLICSTSFRASQFKMLHKLIYTKKLLHICRLVDTNLCERCINKIDCLCGYVWLVLKLCMVS